VEFGFPQVENGFAPAEIGPGTVEIDFPPAGIGSGRLPTFNPQL
jgi:hypothetical protein